MHFSIFFFIFLYYYRLIRAATAFHCAILDCTMHNDKYINLKLLAKREETHIEHKSCPPPHVCGATTFFSISFFLAVSCK